MPAKIYPEDTLDTMEDDVIFTGAALTADPDACTLAGSPDEWMTWLIAFREVDRTYRKQVATIDATRVIKDGRLDIEVIDFANDLLHDCGDRDSIRFKGFFTMAPSRFSRIALSDEVATVEGWLVAGTEDNVLEAHRPQLTSTSSEARAALTATTAMDATRATYWGKRTTLADNLTAARDALGSRLSDRARELGLPRDWPGTFFRVRK